MLAAVGWLMAFSTLQILYRRKFIIFFLTQIAWFFFTVQILDLFDLHTCCTLTVSCSASVLMFSEVRNVSKTPLLCIYNIGVAMVISHVLWRCKWVAICIT